MPRFKSWSLRSNVQRGGGLEGPLGGQHHGPSSEGTKRA